MPDKKHEEEEQWEDVDEKEECEGEEEENTTIANSDVVVKYKKAAQWANEVLKELIAACKIGTQVSDLCVFGDELIAKKVASMFKGVEKGAAFPTCISVNNCVCHNSPAPGEETSSQILAEKDIVHIDLGIHVDGYPALVAHTIIITTDNQLPDNKEGNVINAAYAALTTAIRKLRPGSKSYDVTEVIEKVAAHFGVTPCDGVLGHELKRYIVDGRKCIPAKRNSEQMVHNYDIQPLTVWTLDVVFSTGKGKLKEGAARTSIYKSNIEGEYHPKMDSARDLVKEIDSTYQYFPFAVRNLQCKKSRLALTELLRHSAVVPYPVLYEKEGEAVAHFKMTLLVTPKKIERVTGIEAQKAIKPAQPFTDPLLLETSKLPFSLEAKKAKK